jgi:hypothetical protein
MRGVTPIYESLSLLDAVYRYHDLIHEKFLSTVELVLWAENLSIKHISNKVIGLFVSGRRLKSVALFAVGLKSSPDFRAKSHPRLF